MAVTTSTFQPGTAVLLGCALVSLACDGSARQGGAEGNGDGGMNTAEASTAAQAFVDQLAQAACVAIARCGEADLTETRSYTGTGETCVKRMRPRLAVGYRTEVALAAAGRARPDAARIARCLETIRGTCIRVSTLVSGGVCTRLFTGTVPEGGACSDSLECAPDAVGNDGWCEVSQGATDGCGQCRPSRPPGARCTQDQECSRADAPEGVVCSAGAGLRCTRLDIGPEAAAGQRCGTFSSAELISQVPCGAGLWCDITDDSRSGVCRPPVAAGAPCEQGRSVCQDGHVCPESVSTCQPFIISDMVGATCSDDGSSPVCNHYASVTCKQGSCRPLGAEGDSCAGEVDCDFGLFCDDASARCLRPGAEGSPCQDDSDCIDERCLAPPGSNEGTCRARTCGRA